MTTQVIRAIQVTDSMSTKYKNDMWTKITNICRLEVRTVRMAQV